MPLLEIHVAPGLRPFSEGFARIRRELGVEEAFPEAVEAHARAVAGRGPRLPEETGTAERGDDRALPLVTIDPPGSRDLDQAFHAERRGGGYRVFYAIADVTAFVAPGDPVDRESLERGVTVYAPDGRAPLHPAVLSEGAASLLPGQDTPALLWALDLDADGALADARLVRSRVRSRRALAYREVQAALDDGLADEPLRLLEEIGRLRKERERARDGVSLARPSQEIVQEDGRYRLVYDVPVPVEVWNAQISLLTGIAAARIMLDAGVGLLRTLPAPDAETLEELRLAARALGIPWSEDASYARFVGGLDPARPAEAAMLAQSARGLRGAGYEAFDGDAPPPEHAAVAAPYAHVTAPLRRVCDRFANEVVLAACAGRRPPGWVLEALPALPKVMGAARRRARAVERKAVDLVEALLLEPRLGERFQALVTHADRRGARVQLREPAVRARVRASGLRLGQELPLRLAAVDAEEGRIRFEVV